MVDLLVDLHGADLGGEGAARAAGDDDRGQEDAHLAQDADGDQVDGEDLGAEAAQLIGALIGQHETDEKGDQPHDRQRVEARLLHLTDQRGEANAPRPQQRVREDDAGMPQEVGQIPGLEGCVHRPPAQSFGEGDERVRRLRLGDLRLVVAGHGLQQRLGTR